MKEKIHYVIEGALAVAVIILFLLHFTGSKNIVAPIAAVSNESNAMEHMPIAYVDIDSLMTNYTYMIDLNEQLAKKYEDTQAKYTEQARKFQNEINDFQRKVETNSFISRERAEAEEKRLIKKNEELQQMQANYAQELDAERFRLHEDFRKTIIVQMNAYNTEKGYHVIFGKTNDNMLYTNEAYNITTDVIEYLNAQYALSPALKSNP